MSGAVERVTSRKPMIAVSREAAYEATARNESKSRPPNVSMSHTPARVTGEMSPCTRITR